MECEGRILSVNVQIAFEKLCANSMIESPSRTFVLSVGSLSASLGINHRFRIAFGDKWGTIILCLICQNAEYTRLDEKMRFTLRKIMRKIFYLQN